MSDAGAQKAGVQALFNTVSPEYDAGPGCFAHFGRRLVEAARIERGQRVLDVASGRGAVLFPAAEHGAEVTGIDLADEMAKATNAEAEHRGVAARVRVMDAEQLDFPDAAFDRVLCGFGLMFFPDQPRALAEMHRVLKAGGLLALTTWQVSQAEELARTALKLGHGSGSPPGWINKPDVLRELLERSGFRHVRVAPESKEFRYAGLDEYWQQARGTGLRGLLDRVEGEERRRLREAFAERVKEALSPDGLFLTATALVATAER